MREVCSFRISPRLSLLLVVSRMINLTVFISPSLPEVFVRFSSPEMTPTKAKT